MSPSTAKSEFGRHNGTEGFMETVASMAIGLQ